MHSMVTAKLQYRVIWQMQREVNEKVKSINKVIHLNSHGREDQKIGQVTAKGRNKESKLVALNG